MIIFPVILEVENNYKSLFNMYICILYIHNILHIKFI